MLAGECERVETRRIEFLLLIPTGGTHTSELPVDPEQITIARKYVVEMPIGLEPCDNDNMRGAWP